MPPLTLDDLIPLSEFIAQRSQHAAAQARYLERYRRVRIGPRLTVTFENRQTLWFRVHEMLRVARLVDPPCVQRELDLFNRLLPGRGQLQAAVHIDIAEGPEWAEQMNAWRGLTAASLRLVAGERNAATRLITSRPEDACFGVAHWVEFAIDDGMRAALDDRRKSAMVVVEYQSCRQQSGPLNETLRQSLLDDLALSDRDMAA